MKTHSPVHLALAHALAHVPTAAFVCGGRGGVLFANPAGTSWLAADPTHAGQLAAPVPARFEVTPFTEGREARYLAILRESYPDDALPRGVSRWRFTQREREVVALVLKGATNQAIAQVLACSLRTVEHHVSSMLRKVDVENRASLILAILQA